MLLFDNVICIYKNKSIKMISICLYDIINDQFVKNKFKFIVFFEVVYIVVVKDIFELNLLKDI